MTSNKEAKIQFYDGVNEPVVPEIRLTRDKNGTTGQAFFIFEKPQALSKLASGEITGMKLIDDEDWENVCKAVLEYYDKCYEYELKNKKDVKILNMGLKTDNEIIKEIKNTLTTW